MDPSVHNFMIPRHPHQATCDGHSAWHSSRSFPQRYLLIMSQFSGYLSPFLGHLSSPLVSLDSYLEPLFQCDPEATVVVAFLTSLDWNLLSIILLTQIHYDYPLHFSGYLARLLCLHFRCCSFPNRSCYSFCLIQTPSTEANTPVAFPFLPSLY
ncbi:uncharacterized protein BYT42DRAFT_172645 [Radiomyces spectabilis]|uniref:uncharacterized protein n=1 Tax=Radiomyces spectabilis TaxID=64574 RepID=UPI00221FBD8E|nr:uncharacterized protein BYT42DRAFT_172645 [Radiomyces spectabilis]KAI8390858.1 hypothetical protein BYT42DRAFT_172645 [Radiomyces spectabilis]